MRVAELTVPCIISSAIVSFSQLHDFTFRVADVNSSQAAGFCHTQIAPYATCKGVTNAGYRNIVSGLLLAVQFAFGLTHIWRRNPRSLSQRTNLNPLSKSKSTRTFIERATLAHRSNVTARNTQRYTRLRACSFLSEGACAFPRANRS